MKSQPLIVITPLLRRTSDHVPCTGTDCSDITSSNDSSDNIYNVLDTQNDIQDSYPRRQQRREGRQTGYCTSHNNKAIVTQATSTITARQFDPQLSSEHCATTDTEEEMMLCTTEQSRTYGSFIAPLVNFAHMVHRTLCSYTDVREESGSTATDPHTSDEPDHRKVSHSRNRHL